MKICKLLPVTFLIYLFLSCQNPEKTLPILGFSEVIEGDTIFHSIPDFKFVNQDSIWVTNKDYEDYIYVADFFFTSCPSICPKVKKQMLRIYEKYLTDNRIMMISHTIDPKRDKVAFPYR